MLLLTILSFFLFFFSNSLFPSFSLLQRFKLCCILFSVTLWNWSEMNAFSLSTLLFIFLAEVVVDCLKHVSMANFTGESPLFYIRTSSKFLKLLRKPRKSTFLSDWSMRVSNMIGILPHALSLIMVKMSILALPEDPHDQVRDFK